MATEDEIKQKLINGYTVDALLNEHYRKSTIYKVKKLLETLDQPIRQWAFTIYDVMLNRLPYESFPRFDPKGRIVVEGKVKNTRSSDLYVSRVGIMPEWLDRENRWYSIEESFLLKPNKPKSFAFTLNVDDLENGEYTLKFGIDGQWLGPNISGNSPSIIQEAGTIWAEPLILHLKKQYSGKSVFISHSVKDMEVVRAIENFLDNNGIKVSIGEEVTQPGALLQQKFKSLIDQSDMMLVILTENSLRSKWVKMECDYAFQVKKTVVPVKEKSVNIIESWWPSEIEWIEFSLRDPIQLILQTIMDGIRTVIRRAKKSVNADFIEGLFTGALVVGILALIFGASKK